MEFLTHLFGMTVETLEVTQQEVTITFIDTKLQQPPSQRLRKKLRIYVTNEGTLSVGVG